MVIARTWEQAAAELTGHYRNLQECMLQDVRWDQFGSLIHLDFDYIWGDSGPEEWRPGEDGKRPVVTLSCSTVERLSLDNGWTAGTRQAANRRELTWGVSEVAGVAIAPTASSQEILVDVSWESDRRLMIFCRDVALTLDPALQPST